MAAGNLCICVLLALTAGNLILAEEERAFPMSFNPMDFFNMFFGGGDRSKRAAEETQSRFLPYLTSCNYTNSSQAGTQCSSCNTAVRCYPSNVALVRQCSGFLQYCNGGRCSTRPGPLCSSNGSGSGSGSNSTSSNSTSSNSTGSNSTGSNSTSG